jgi:RNA polymerase sigma-70 factor (ECF subfamily)
MCSKKLRFFGGVAMKISDEILIQQVQQGNERAFNQLVQRYQERIINVCFRIVGNFQDAEEAAMDTFLACYRSLSTFEGRSSFATWLYRIAMRTAYKQRERCPPGSIPIDELEIPENRLTTQPDRILKEQEIKKAVEQTIETLPEHLKEAVIFYFLEGLSYREIAEILACPIGTVCSRINAARRQLRRKLKHLIEE